MLVNKVLYLFELVPIKKTPTMMYQMKKYHVMVKNKLHEFCHVIARLCCISIKIKTSGKTY